VNTSAVHTRYTAALWALLWLIPVALLALLVVVVAAALQTAERPEAQAPVVSGGGFPVTVVEPGGQRVLVIHARPERIVAADAGMADVLSALVEPSRIVAVPDTVEGYAAQRELFAAHTEIARFARFKAETVLSYKPDLVVAVTFRDNPALAILEERGIPVFRVEQFRTFDGIRAGMAALGRAVGEEEKARRLVAEFDRRLAAVERAVAGLRKPRALIYSKFERGYAVGAGESQDEALRRAGAVNAAAEAGWVSHVHVTFEQILKLNPDYLVVAGTQGLESPQALIVLNEPVLAELPAVKRRRIVVVPDCYGTAISQYAVNAVENMARAFHPEAFTKPEGRR
jgi:iron complex transport system substrate-binding protein